MELFTLLKETGVSGADVARDLGISKSTVSRFLTGDRKGLPNGGGERTFRASVSRIAERKQRGTAA